MTVLLDPYRFAVAGGAWAPDDVTGLIAWYDFSDTATITHTSNEVTQVDDKSGNARNITQGTAGRYPITNTRTVNGLNVLDFSSGFTQLLVSSAFTQAQPFHVFMAFENDTTGTAQSRIWSVGGTTTSYMQVNTYRIYAGTGVVDSGDATDTSPHYRADLFNGASSVMRLDGAVIGSGNPGTGAWASDAHAIGAQTTASNGWDGAIGEWFAYDAELSGSDLTDAESYLAAKWIA